VGLRSQAESSHRWERRQVAPAHVERTNP
jgi:hypothetical protein